MTGAMNKTLMACHHVCAVQHRPTAQIPRRGPDDGISVVGRPDGIRRTPALRPGSVVRTPPTRLLHPFGLTVPGAPSVFVCLDDDLHDGVGISGCSTSGNGTRCARMWRRGSCIREPAARRNTPPNGSSSGTRHLRAGYGDHDDQDDLDEQVRDRFVRRRVLASQTLQCLRGSRLRLHHIGLEQNDDTGTGYRHLDPWRGARVEYANRRRGDFLFLRWHRAPL